MTIYGTELATLEWPDILAIVVYFCVTLGVALWASCKATKDTSAGFFLGGRSMTWIPIGASTFSTNVGAPMFLGLAGSAAATGMSVVTYEWHAMWTLLILGWLFLPVYISSGCYTMPQYLKMRFGGKRIWIWLSVLFQFILVISQISTFAVQVPLAINTRGQMYAGVVFIQQIFHWTLYPSIILILGITAIFNIIGGLNVVIWTDTIQTIILVAGSFTVTGIALVKVGGYNAMWNQFMHAAANYTYRDAALYGNRTCGFPPDNSFHIFRSADDGGYPWPGMTVGLFILAIYAWCTDQTCVQRSLAAKNMTHAKAGVVLAAYLKFLSFMLFIVPGMISRVLYPDEVGCADPDICNNDICGNRAGCSDIAYPLLVLRILPRGVRGLMMAALLSALITSLTSYFNSSSTVFTMDLYKLCRPKAKESEKMVVGRLWVLLLACVGAAWLPILQALKGSQFWNYTQSISSFLVPPIVMSFLFGIFWKRTTEPGIFYGLVVGLIVGVTRMGLEWSRTASPCGDPNPYDDRFDVVARVHFLHFACILAGVTSIVIVVVSLFTKPRPEEKLRRVTWWTRSTKELQELSDDDDNDEEDDDINQKKAIDSEPEIKEKELPEEDCGTKLKHGSLKFLCGIDRTAKQTKLTKEEIRAIQLKSTSLKQDPFWKKIVDVNAIICAMFCFFIHAFYY